MNQSSLRISTVWRLAAASLLFLLPTVIVFGQDTKTDTSNRLEEMMLSARAFREAAAVVQPALVTIESFGGSGVVAGKIGGIRKQGEGNTTGLLIDDQGYIVTSSFNFIQRPPVITIITSDGQRHFGHLLGTDNTRKISVLKIEDPPAVRPLTCVPVEEVKIGQWAISVGVGFGDSNPAISVGIISAKNRVGGKAIQTDANISPACYGGPLIDLHGQVLGICVPLNPQSQAIGAGVEWYDSGIGFAIPLGELASVLERLKNNETIDPAFLGVQTLAGEPEQGLVIQEVVPDSPAAEAGLKATDELLEFDGETITDVIKLKQLISRRESGEKVAIKYRDGESKQESTIEVVLGKPPATNEQSQLEPPKIR